MITGTSSNFTAMIEGTERTAVWRVQMTLTGSAAQYSDLTLAINTLTLNGSTTSDMPEGTRLQVGYPALACSFTAEGMVDQTDESKTSAWLFNPYSTTSPLYRSNVLYAQVTVDIGLYTDANAGTVAQGTPEYVRKFTGLVDDYTVGDDGTVSFTCIDITRSMLRSIASTPMVASIGTPSSSTDPTDLQEVTAEYVIDAVLRAATAGAYSSWPPQLSSCRLALGWRGSHQPEVGQQYGDSARWNKTRMAFVPGVFGTAVTIPNPALDMDPSNSALFSDLNQWALDPPIALDGTFGGVYIECWVTGMTNGVLLSLYALGSGGTGDTIVMSLSYEPSVSKFRVNVNDAGVDHITDLTTPAGLVDDLPHYLAVQFNGGASGGGMALTSVTVWVDGHQLGPVTVTTSATFTAPGYFYNFRPNLGPTVTMEAVQVATSSSAFLHSVFRPKAVLDQSLNVISAVPSVSGDPYQVIQQLCDAELAVAGGDETGVFRFYNRDTLRSRTSSRDFTSAASLTSLGAIEIGASSVVNHSTVEWTGWDVDGSSSFIYAAEAPIRIRKGQTLTITPTLTNPAVVTAGSLSFGVTADGDVTVKNGYRASVDKAGTTDFGTGLFAKVRQNSRTGITITLTNNGSSDAWLVSPASFLDVPVGTPFLKIAGVELVQTVTTTTDLQYPAASDGGAASSKFGDQAHQISGNPWIQDADVAASLAQDIVMDMYLPRPNLTSVSVVPDPRVQLTDVVRLRDPDVTGIDEYARVFGYTINWQGGESPSFDMTIDARTIGMPGGWIGGIAGRSEGGQTTYGY